MSDDKQNTKATLLDELESIKHLLDEDNRNSCLACPDVIESKNVSTQGTTISEPILNPEEENSAVKNNSQPTASLAPGVLPGQQSLFELCPESSIPEANISARGEGSSSLKSTSSDLVSAAQSDSPNKANSSSNPFLADRIKARGDNRTAQLPEPAFDVTETLSENEVLQQIDAIVASYLPKLEAELREKLKRKLLP